jgi:glycosyltransferase involved in cell wall biosynthesis
MPEQAARDQQHLVIEGWREISHSYALVNQWQLLGLMRQGVELKHYDVPFRHDSWNHTDAKPGFNKPDLDLLKSINPFHGDRSDVAYRIAHPLACPETKAARRLSFSTCEHWATEDLGLDAEQFRSFLDVDCSVVTPSNWSALGLHQLGIPLERLYVVPHGVATAYFHPDPPEIKNSYRQSLGFTPDHFVILSLGAMTSNKGIDLLLRAFAALVDTHPHIRLVLKDHACLYGDGPLDSLRDFLRDNPGLFNERVTQRILILGGNRTLADLRSLYAMADCYASPYRAEGFGLTPLEAAACGTPIIVTSGGATDDYVHPSFALGIEADIVSHDTMEGFFLEPNFDSLVDGLQTMIEGRARDLNRDEALTRIGSQHDWGTVCRQLERVLTGS